MHLKILGFPMGGANTNTGIFSRGLKLCGQSRTSKCSWYQKRKFGVTIHFSEMTKLQFGKNQCHTLLCILLFLIINVAKLSLKECVVTPNSLFFFISIALLRSAFPA